jgi:hypothetical protein
MKVLNVYYHEQSLIVLVMVCVQIKGLVMIQLDPAYAMKDLRGTFVQVTTNIISNSFDWIIKYHIYYFQMYPVLAFKGVAMAMVSAISQMELVPVMKTIKD